MRSIHHVLSGASGALSYGACCELSDDLDALDGGVQAIDDQLGMGWSADFAGYRWSIAPINNPPPTGEKGATSGVNEWIEIIDEQIGEVPAVHPGTVVEVHRDGSARDSRGRHWSRGFGPGTPHLDGTPGPGFRPGRYAVRGPRGDIYRMMHRIRPEIEIVEEVVPVEFRRDPDFVIYWRDQNFRRFYRDPWFRHYWRMPEFRRAWGHPGFAERWHDPHFRRDFDRPEFRRSWHRPEFRARYEREHPHVRSHEVPIHHEPRPGAPVHHEGHPGLPPGIHNGAPRGEPPPRHGPNIPMHAMPPSSHAAPSPHLPPASSLSHALPEHPDHVSTWSGPKLNADPPRGIPRKAAGKTMSGADDDEDMGRVVSPGVRSGFSRGPGPGRGPSFHGGGYGPLSPVLFSAAPVVVETPGAVLSQVGDRVTVQFQGAAAPTIVARAVLNPSSPYFLPPGAAVSTAADVEGMSGVEQYYHREAERYRPDSWRRHRLLELARREREAEREREEWERRERERWHHPRHHYRYRPYREEAHGSSEHHYRYRPYREMGDAGFCMGDVGDAAHAAEAHQEHQVQVATHNALQAARAQISVARESLWDRIVAAARAGEMKALAALRASAKALFALAYRVVGSADAAVAVACASPAEIAQLADKAAKGETIAASPKQYQAMLQPAFVKATPGAALPAEGAPAPIAPEHAAVKSLPVATTASDGKIVVDPEKAVAHASLTAIPPAEPSVDAKAEPAPEPPAADLPSALRPVADAPSAEAPAPPPAPAPIAPLLPLEDEDDEDGEDGEDGYTPPLDREIDAGPPRVQCGGGGACRVVRTEDEPLDAEEAAPDGAPLDELEPLDAEEAAPVSGPSSLEDIDEAI